MADNYLEKQYADYEKRRAEWERQKKFGKLPKTKKKVDVTMTSTFFILSIKFILHYPKKDSNIPAATAEPITPATLGPMACISRKLEGLAS